MREGVQRAWISARAVGAEQGMEQPEHGMPAVIFSPHCRPSLNRASCELYEGETFAEAETGARNWPTNHTAEGHWGLSDTEAPGPVLMSCTVFLSL